MEYSNLFVCLMGLCTVFVGLICIILLLTLMSWICRKTESAAPAAPAAPSVDAAAVTTGTTPELIAAISAAIAEELGTDVSAIRITSLKKL